MLRRVDLSYLVRSFFQIGLSSFGGYTALIAVVQKKMVEQDKVLEEQTVIDGLSIAAILPGPLAVNIVSYIGFTLRGWIGALISMFAVLLPSCIFMILLVELSSRYGNISFVSSFINGVLPVIMVIILRVALQMGKKHVREIWQYILTIGVLVVSFFFSGYLVVLILIGIGALLGMVSPNSKDVNTQNVVFTEINYRKLLRGLILVLIVFFASFFIFKNESRELLLVFSKVSLTLFGGGYVMIPALFELVVDQENWLSSIEFSRAITFGQMTPGPILVSATYVGYHVNGFVGAFLATVGIFLPSSILMIVVGAGFLHIKDHPVVANIMNGIRSVVVGLIGFSVFILFDSVELPITTIIFAIMAYFLLTFAKLNFFLVILFSGLIGLFFF